MLLIVNNIIFRVSGNSSLQRLHSFHLALNRSSPSFHSVPKFLATTAKRTPLSYKSVHSDVAGLTDVKNSRKRSGFVIFLFFILSIYSSKKKGM